MSISIRRWPILIFAIAVAGVVLTLVAWALPVVCPVDGIPCADPADKVPAMLRGVVGVIVVAIVGGVIGWRFGATRILVLVIHALSAVGAIVSVLAAGGYFLAL